MRVEQLETADGSWTLRDLDRDLTFRSIHGAATESDHVFVAPSAITEQSGGQWRVLELGFGGGLNFRRTLSCALAAGVELDYVAFERAPVPVEYLLCDDPADVWIESALASGSGEQGGTRLTIHRTDWADRVPLRTGFDAIYHDPFGPQDNPTSWTAECFQWSRDLVRSTGRLMTDAVAGHVRRALQAAGWRVEKRPGPPGKREVLLAFPASQRSD